MIIKMPLIVTKSLPSKPPADSVSIDMSKENSDLVHTTPNSFIMPNFILPSGNKIEFKSVSDAYELLKVIDPDDKLSNLNTVSLSEAKRLENSFAKNIIDGLRFKPKPGNNAVGVLIGGQEGEYHVVYNDELKEKFFLPIVKELFRLNDEFGEAIDSIVDIIKENSSTVVYIVVPNKPDFNKFAPYYNAIKDYIVEILTGMNISFDTDLMHKKLQYKGEISVPEGKMSFSKLQVTYIVGKKEVNKDVDVTFFV